MLWQEEYNCENLTKHRNCIIVRDVSAISKQEINSCKLFIEYLIK